MYLETLHITALRNLSSIHLSLNPQFNFFIGQNGSGKTSLLEALYLLAMGQSFRSASAKDFITYGQKSCVVSGKLHGLPDSPNQSVPIGVEKTQQGGTTIHIAEQDCPHRAVLAKLFPVQRIDHTSFSLLVSEPTYRRSYLDWIMFHVEHEFHEVWQKYRRTLQQRNAGIKAGEDLSVWNELLVELGNKLDFYRRQALKGLMPHFLNVLEQLLPLKQTVSLHYESGWPEELTLEECVTRYHNRDKLFGYTTFGPQKADMEWLIDGIPAKTALSRGQIKLFVCALLLARATLLFELTDQKCAFLVDDLQAELDKGASERLVMALQALQSQVFMTNIHLEAVEELLEIVGGSCFEVNSGEIQPLDVLIATE